MPGPRRAAVATSRRVGRWKRSRSCAPAASAARSSRRGSACAAAGPRTSRRLPPVPRTSPAGSGRPVGRPTPSGSLLDDSLSALMLAVSPERLPSSQRFPLFFARALPPPPGAAAAREYAPVALPARPPRLGRRCSATPPRCKLLPRTVASSHRSPDRRPPAAESTRPENRSRAAQAGTCHAGDGCFRRRAAGGRAGGGGRGGPDSGSRVPLNAGCQPSTSARQSAVPAARRGSAAWTLPPPPGRAVPREYARDAHLRHSAAERPRPENRTRAAKTGTRHGGDAAFRRPPAGRCWGGKKHGRVSPSKNELKRFKKRAESAQPPLTYVIPPAKTTPKIPAKPTNSHSARLNVTHTAMRKRPADRPPPQPPCSNWPAARPHPHQARGGSTSTPYPWCFFRRFFLFGHPVSQLHFRSNQPKGRATWRISNSDPWWLT